MKVILLVTIMIVLATVQSLFCKFFTDAYPGDESTITPVLPIVGGLMMTVVAFIFSGFRFEASLATVLFGLLNAAVLYCYNLFIVRASLLGEYSILMSFNLAGGIVVPAVIEAVFFSQPLGVVRIFAIVLVVAAGYLINSKSDPAGVRKKTNLRFLLVSLALGLSNGIYGELLNLQQRVCSPAEREEMIAVTYMGSVVVSLVVLLIRRQKGERGGIRFNRKSVVFLLVCATSTALAINLLVWVIALLENQVTVLYTFDNAGALLLSVIASCIFLKEKLSGRNIVGCVLMCFALTVMSISTEITAWLGL